MEFSYSCSKENENKPNVQNNQPTPSNFQQMNSVDEQLTFYYGEYQSNSKDIWGKIWKWIKAHSGTHLFENCQGNMECGPCAGFCAVAYKSADIFIPVNESDGISSEDYAVGERLFQIALFNDTILGFSFIQSDLVYNDSVYFPNDFNIGGSASALFQKDSIIILQGVYPVSFSHGRNGSAVVDVVSY